MDIITTELAQPELQILLARQGIYDPSGKVYGYEILYRNNSPQLNLTSNDELDGVKATSSVIAQLFANLDIHHIAGNKPIFINFTYTDLILKIPQLLPKERVYIEVTELNNINTLLIDSLIQLNNDGYKIVLDGFIYREDLIPLIKIADIIKINVLNKTKETIAESLQPLQPYNKKLVAVKIDSKEQFKLCMELGFHYFQGFFLNMPDPIKGQVISENTSLLLRILGELNNDDISVAQLERSILQIPRLSYRILLVANSAYYYSGKGIKSLTDAIFRIGVNKIKNWANIILLASNPDTLRDLTERTLIRAYMCESIAKLLKINAEKAYAIGMFSTLDGMLNQPLPVLLSKIQLEEPLNKALLFHEGKLGRILKSVIDYEQANFTTLDELNLDKNQIMNFYLDGIKYADSTLGIVV